MSLETLISEARTKIEARNKKRAAVVKLHNELDAVRSTKLDAEDGLDETRAQLEDALASGDKAAATKAQEKLRSIADLGTTTIAHEAGLLRRIEAAETEAGEAATAATAALVRVARAKCRAIEFRTRALAEQVARSHAEWHRIAMGIAAIASESSGNVEEPIPHRDPGSSALMHSQHRFDEGLVEDFRRGGLAAHSAGWWQPSARLLPASEAEILTPSIAKPGIVDIAEPPEAA